ncbi:MAG TPA: hypothetical protein VLY63_21825 [Anaerolineae bacterium]|nr:hypothetical protein [Anaerolineae bacterium]
MAEPMNIGLMNCSGACFPAILARRACNVAAYKSDWLSEVCLVEHTIPLLTGDPSAIDRSLKALRSYDAIIAESGCGSACATRLLEMYGIAPREFHMSEFAQVAGRTPPFTTEDVDRLLRDHLDKAVTLVQRFSQEVTDKEEITEVVIGTANPVKIGGVHKHGYKNPPVVAFEVYDWPPPLPTSVRNAYHGRLHDPVAWAKSCVEDYGAQMICLELLSTSPYTANRTPEEAVETVLSVVDAVDVPLMIGGSGDVAKDSQVLPAVADAVFGERVLLSSLTLDNFKAIAPAAVKNGHAVLAATTMSLETAMAFNRDLMGEGIREDSIVMDLSTCPLGYGYEYSYTLVERSTLRALDGNRLAQPPVLFCPANSWAARESRAKEPGWGDPSERGAMWETVAGIGGLVAGAHLLLVLDPAAGVNLNTFIEEEWPC